MRTSLALEAGERPRKMLGIRELPSEGARKPLADAELSRMIGRAIERALANTGIEKKAAAAEMGYADQSSLARWIAGIETANLAKLWRIGPKFQKEFVTALAAECSEFQVDTVITARRTA